MKRKLLTIVLSLLLILCSVRLQEAKAATLSGRVASIDGREIMIEVIYPGGHEKMAKMILDTMIESFPALENLWGVPYPYPNIKVDTFYESATTGSIRVASSLTGVFYFNLHPDASVDRGTIIHELNHSWHFGKSGNDITRGTVEQRWFDEASSEANAYLVLKTLGFKEEGFSDILWPRAWYLNKYISYDVPLAKWGYQSGTSLEENRKVLFGYSKGAFFMLRIYEVVGTDAMKRVWKRVFEKTPVKTIELTTMIEEEYGGNLDWLWSGWLYEGEYRDPWWIDWRVNLPQKLEELQKESDELSKSLAVHKLSMKKISDRIQDAREYLQGLWIDETRSLIKEIEKELAEISEFSSKFDELMKTKDENKDLMEKYGKDLNADACISKAKLLFDSGSYKDALSEIDSLAGEIENLIESVKNAEEKRDEIRNFMETNKKEFGKSGLSARPMEDKFLPLEEALFKGDFSGTSRLSEEIRGMISRAKDAHEAYEDALDANGKRGLLGTDSSSLISQAKDAFDNGDYALCKRLSSQAKELNGKTNTVSLMIMAVVALTIICGGAFLLKKRRKPEKEAVEGEKKECPSCHAPNLSDSLYCSACGFSLQGDSEREKESV